MFWELRILFKFLFEFVVRNKKKNKWTISFSFLFGFYAKFSTNLSKWYIWFYEIRVYRVLAPIDMAHFYKPFNIKRSHRIGYNVCTFVCTNSWNDLKIKRSSCRHTNKGEIYFITRLAYTYFHYPYKKCNIL